MKDILAAIRFPKSTYMYWQKRLDREDPDVEVKEVMLAIRKKHANYGHIPMKKELMKCGLVVNKKKVQRLIRELDIRVVAFTRKSRRYSSYKGTVGRVAQNRINRRFSSTIPYQKITTDTTEFKYYEADTTGKLQMKKLYLDPFLDLFNREIISYSISTQPNGETIMEALEKAIEATKGCQFRRTFHSDQGWAYQMKAYSAKIKEHKIFQSMSRRGNCLDNSPMENFFGILKQEIYYGKIYRSFRELERAITAYIHYYNHERMKEKLGWVSPIEYRLNHMASELVT